MLDRGDKYYMAICNQTGMIAIYNPSKNLFMSPMADGPIRFTGSLDDNSMYIENITKFGRDFSIVCVPYSIKLLIQELQTINIQMRIITDDNIQQIENLSYSKNIEKLMRMEGATTKDVVRDIKNTLLFEREREKEKDSSLKFDWKIPEESTDIDLFTPSSPTEPPPWSLVPPASSTEETIYSPSSPPYVVNEGMNYQREKSPNSPEYSSEPPVDLSLYRGGEGRGGKSSSPHHQHQHQHHTSEPFQEGEQVYYRGDPYHELWSIKHAEGGEYITIERERKEGYTIEDCIKVVSPTDIYRPSDIVHYPIPPPQMDPHQHGQYTHSPYDDPMNPQQMPYGGINVNPVIKIINQGSDNSLGNAAPETAIDKATAKIIEKTEKPEKKTEKTEEQSSGGGGLMDFSKFIIKKLSY